MTSLPKRPRVTSPDQVEPLAKKIRKSRSPERRQGTNGNRSSSRDRRNSSEDKDIQEFSKILTDNKPGSEENQNSEF